MDGSEGLHVQRSDFSVIFFYFFPFVLKTPLMLAAMHGEIDCLRKLLESGANVSKVLILIPFPALLKFDMIVLAWSLQLYVYFSDIGVV